jgi:hypothetical protein
MSVKLSDGTVIDTTDINRLLAIVSERAKGHDLTPDQEEKSAEPKPVQAIEIRVDQIRSRDGVTVKVGNLQVKKKNSPNLEHGNYIEVKHRNNHGNYIVRVWRYKREEVFGCNCIEGENIRYMEFPFADYRDENAVFKVVQNWLDGGGMKSG